MTDATSRDGLSQLDKFKERLGKLVKHRPVPEKPE